MPKKSALVLGHLEDVSAKALVKYRSPLRKMIHRRAGIYALYRKGSLYYVGLASGLANRLRRHQRDGHQRQWDRFSVYLTIDDRHMKELESLLLRILKPDGNSQSGRFVDSEDLQYTLLDLVETETERELASVFGGRVAKKIRGGIARNHSGHAALRVFDRRQKLRAQWHGNFINATLRKDGMVSLRGKLYPSPTAAATALGARRNGWTFWQYKDSRGDWVPLETIGKR